MKKLFKWVGIILGGLLGLIIVLVLAIYLIGTRKVNNTYDIRVDAVEVSDNDHTIERGRHFVEAIGLCQECHGENLGGDMIEDDPLFGTLVASNLTSGQGGIGVAFTDVDYVKAIRYGIGKDDKALAIMPSEYYNGISDDDLGAIIAYIKALPPVDNELPNTSLGFLGRIFTLLDSSLLPAGLIDHEAPRPGEPQVGVTKEYGKYLAFICTVCHGVNLSGGSLPGNEPEAPKAPNITPGGAVGDWTKAQFINTIRTGTNPQGKLQDPEFMPWIRFKLMTDDELEAIWLFLQALPAREFEE